MRKDLQAVKITDQIYWVGAIDWGVRNFHGYATHEGTTYNAFLILDEKITLIDTVKKGFGDELFARISSVIDPEKIDYIISNHAEPDHSGVLVDAIERIKPEKIFASKMGVKALTLHFPVLEGKLTAVKDGETLSLGSDTLQFIETRMLHWPDSMFSYLKNAGALFSQDAFGMHVASSERFDDQVPFHTLAKESKAYYANIITPFSPFVARLLTKLEEMDLGLKLVLPDHGPIWRDMDRFGKIIACYKRWANRELASKVIIIYDTMWQSTEIMARYIADGLMSEGVKVKVMPIYGSDRSDIATEMLDAAALIVGSPTLNNNIFPSVMDSLTYIKGFKFKTPLGAVFGSFGWSGEACKQLKGHLEEMGIDVVDPLRTNYIPSNDAKSESFELGVTMAQKVKALNLKPVCIDL